MSHIAADRPRLIARIRRIRGQIEAIERTLDGEAGCAEVLQQVAAARGALNGLMDEIVAGHLREHVARPGLDDAARAAGAEELLAVIRRYPR